MGGTDESEYSIELIMSDSMLTFYGDLSVLRQTGMSLSSILVDAYF